MGQIKNALDAAAALKSQPMASKAEQVANVRIKLRDIGGRILSLAAEYKELLELAEDDDDRAEFQARKVEAVASVKADFDGADDTTKAIINGVLDALRA